MTWCRKIAIILSLSSYFQLQTISIVYNFRVSEITRRYIENQKQQSTLTFLGFEIANKKFDSTTENAIGALGTYLYQRNNLYFQADFAVGHVRSLFACCRFSRTQTDDFLLSIGYSKLVTKKTKITASCLFGFPTHADLSPEGIQFGIAHNSFGLKLDGVFLLSDKGDQSILAAARYLRIFPGNITVVTDNQSTKYDLNIGHLVDLLVGYSYRFKLNGIDFGYNPSFLFGATSCPPIADIETQVDFIRSYFYGAYYRIFLRETHPQVVSLVITYGLEHKPKIYKRFLAVWTTWSINF